jgi:protein-S-isoprenylcysteine O-methyltransferase Ste14
MRWVYDYLFPVMWVAFLVYWQVMSAKVKATQRLEPAASRIVRVIMFGTAIALLWKPWIPLPWLYWHIIPVGFWPFWVGAAMTAAGLLFAVWARIHLGCNWSRSVTIKEDHELIVSGPYALVRHPIYTGILTGFLGTAIALTEVRGVLALVLITISLWAKMRMEEKFMRDQFGATYVNYSKRVAALVPFVL